MPITQDRLIRLIDIADTFQTTLKRIHKIARDLRDNNPDIESAKAQIWAIFEPNHPALNEVEKILNAYYGLADIILEQQIDPDDLVHLGEERAHFKATARRNNRVREAIDRMRARQRGEDVPFLAPGRPRTQPRASTTLPAADEHAERAGPLSGEALIQRILENYGGRITRVEAEELARQHEERRKRELAEQTAMRGGVI